MAVERMNNRDGEKERNERGGGNTNIVPNFFYWKKKAVTSPRTISENCGWRFKNFAGTPLVKISPANAAVLELRRISLPLLKFFFVEKINSIWFLPNEFLELEIIRILRLISQIFDSETVAAA